VPEIIEKIAALIREMDTPPILMESDSTLIVNNAGVTIACEVGSLRVTTDSVLTREV
jgi:hypothetical protein